MGGSAETVVEKSIPSPTFAAVGIPRKGKNVYIGVGTPSWGGTVAKLSSQLSINNCRLRKPVQPGGGEKAVGSSLAAPVCTKENKVHSTHHCDLYHTTFSVFQRDRLSELLDFTTFVDVLTSQPP